MATIFADMRETTSGVIRHLQGLSGCEVKIVELSSGDYVLHETTCVERKAASDFVASIMDGRLINQIAKMKNEFESPIILIEGNVFKTVSKISKEALVGAMSYCTAIEKVSLITVADSSETALMIATMARHLQDGLGYEVPMRSSKPKPSAHMAQYLVEGLPGIGPKNARALLAHFGSPAKVFAASVTDLCSMKGLALKRAEAIYGALHWNANDAAEIPIPQQNN